MPRYVDVDELRTKALGAKNYDPEMLVIGLGYAFKLSTADVAPIVHAQWNYANSICLYECTNCGYHPESITSYCPSCGAEMD